MTRIYVSDPLEPAVKVMADAWLRSQGAGRVRVARTYRKYTHRGGTAEEYLLMRYEGRDPIKGRCAKSCMLQVEGQGFQRTFTEVFSCLRKEEPDRILQWQEENGAIMDGVRE